MTLLAEVVATSERVGATSKRTEKIAALAALLRALEPGEIEPAVGFLTGTPGQGRVGIGWATLGAVRDVGAPPAAAPSLTVADVDTAIDEVVATTGAGSVEARRQILGRLLGRATHAEQDFLHRLLLGELRQGALEGLMADAIAKASGCPQATVRRAAMMAGDLARTARLALTEGAPGLDAVRLEVLRPVQPMLAGSAPDVAAALEATGPASVEWKLDGARVQAHRRGDEVRLYTRNLNDVTDRLPGIADAVRTLEPTELVLDGEAIGLDDELRPLPFQDTMSGFDVDGGGALRALFFDVLRVDGRDLVDAPLHERRSVLDAVVGPHRVPGIVTADAVEAQAFLDDALARGHEGVVVKALDAGYEAGRRGQAWRKVKPVRTLDLVVLAVEWGHGRRTGWLSNLHLGARDPEHPGELVMVGKTFKGLTDALLRWQTEQLLARQIGSDGHVVHVRPELVVEIALDGVQRSPRYRGGVALRFARVLRYRPDKHADEADTIDAVRALLPGGAPA